MLDVFGLPTTVGRSDVQTFTGPGTVTNLQWATWLKPRGKSMLSIVAMSGGGGGGGGFTGISGAARAGGGGGASSGVTNVIVPLHLLPDVLYIQCGAGGIGVGSGGATAGSGILSYVAIHPDTTALNVLCISGAAGPLGGSTGTGTTAGAASVTAGTIAVIGSMPLAGLGFFYAIAGQIGTIGGTTTGPGGNITIPLTSCIAMGGTGGGGCTGTAQAGGAITAAASSLISANRPAQAAAGESGSGGFIMQKTLWVFGGLGAGSVNAATGLPGGDGGPGAGGGGGSAGTTGGKGGNGGPGIVIMTCW